MKNDKVTINDVLEALAIRLNDVLRPDKKSKNKKNNAYFWAFKFILLIALLFLINFVFRNFEEIGVSLIYSITKSLRSVLSYVWVISLNYIKGLVILYLLFDNLKIFVESDYFKNLYEDNRKMRQNKDTIFKIVEIILKVYAVFYMIGISLLGIASIYALFTILFMLLKNIYIISPIIIFGGLFFVSYFTFMHIKNKFFGKKQTIVKNHFIFAFVLLILGVVFFAYETSSYEHINGLPDEMEIISKQSEFDLKEGKKINIKNNSKLNNLEVIYDDKLENKMIVTFDYFETADVKYIYTFNENDDLNLTFTSKLNFQPENLNDVLKLINSTFNRKTLYNYNLFKYPNIIVRIDSKYKKSLKID